MNQQTVKVNFHGVLQELGKTWNLAIHSVGEAVHAINTIKKGRLNKTLLDNDKKGIKYRVLINGRDFLCEETPTLDKPETIQNSELTFKFNEGKLKTIDFVPVLEGADGDFFSIIAGVLLIIVGIVLLLIKYKRTKKPIKEIGVGKELDRPSARIKAVRNHRITP